LEVAARFGPYLEQTWPAYVEEMQGVAEGAGVPYALILVLNVRSEIAFGIMSDGCTTFSLQTPTASFLAQNWDVLPPAHPCRMSHR
jgi:isopenicillin-N N-acyltransferase-like protein